MKFEIEFPKTVDQNIVMDKENGSTLWDNAIAKDIKNVQVAFGIREKGEPPPVGHQSIKSHIIFNVKMQDLRRKEKMVTGGHMTSTPPTITYYNVVSCEMVRIALTVAALHDLSVKIADIMNCLHQSNLHRKVLHHHRAGVWTGQTGFDCDYSVIVWD